MRPYASPLIEGFRGAPFQQLRRRFQPVVRLAVHKEGFHVGPRWTRYEPAGWAPPRGWLLKLYACLGPASYWAGILKLISAFEESKVTWKFYNASSGYERPDKIVFYTESPRKLRQLVRKLRGLLGRSRFHKMHHAATTHQMGLEGPTSAGLYVGCDPTFMPRLSFRMYRTICYAWAEQNRGYLARLPGGGERWFLRMNLSSKHEGPASLNPDPANIRYVKRYWRLIMPG
ncbi:MAG: hypothetical protein HY698_00820 [Deltaproteobacteria bacterium]|nr:hypothetical protein [Deltaproteobacteria bacterium]